MNINWYLSNSVNSLHQSLTTSPRTLKIFTSLVNHLHAFARETQLTHAEWRTAIDFLTRAGKESTEFKNEFVLLSDCLGFSVLVDELEHPRPEVRAQAPLPFPCRVRNVNSRSRYVLVGVHSFLRTRSVLDDRCSSGSFRLLAC